MRGTLAQRRFDACTEYPDPQLGVGAIDTNVAKLAILTNVPGWLLGGSAHK